jgi:hypothetical protein
MIGYHVVRKQEHPFWIRKDWFGSGKKLTRESLVSHSAKNDNADNNEEKGGNEQRKNGQGG